MATLYEASNTGRKIVLGFLVLTAIVLVIEFIGNLNREAQLGGRNPARFYMNPDRKFGDIARPEIPGIPIDSSSRPSYALESVFTLLPDVAYVYQVDRPREKLGDFEAAQGAVRELGFNPLIFTTEGNNFTWNTASDTRTVVYNKETLNWSLSTKYADNIEAKKTKILNTDITTYSRNALNLVDELGFEATGIESGLVDSRYAKYNNGTFFSNENPLEADYVIINIFKKLPFADLKPTDELPSVSNRALIPKALSAYVYTEDPRVGQVRIVASNNLRDYPKDVYELKYNDFEYTVDPSTGNTVLLGSYLIITPEEAWTKISNNQGSLVSLIPQGGNYFGENPPTAQVNRFVADRSRTELAYYEPSEWTGYVYPIYIFRGRAEMADGRQASFVYYVEAIKRVD